MNPLARAICVAALLLSFAHVSVAADQSARPARLLINYPNAVRCYDAGRVEFQDWKPLPGYNSVLRPGRTVLASTAQLSPDQLRQVIDAVDEYLANPAPFIYANYAASDQHYSFIEVRHDETIRLTCVRYMPNPPAIKDLFAKIREPLAAAKVTSLDWGRRGEILESFKPADPPSPSQARIQSRYLASMPNDDPGKLITSLFDASGRHRIYFTQALHSLAGLEDTTFGDTIYANIQLHRDTLSEGQQAETLAIAIESGPIQAMAEYPTVEHFPGALHNVITSVFDANDLRIVAVRIGVSSITPSNARVAWNWLASNTDQLQFDRITRQYHIVGNLHPVVMSRHADILALESSQPPARFVVERLWAIALVVSLFAGVRFARAVRKRIRAKARRCVTCGYDLRGTPLRCPECGTPAVAVR
jgi:hypothetical protein